MATLYDGRIILIDEDFNIVKDTYALEEEKTMVSEEVVKCFKGEASGYYASGRFVELTVPIMAGLPALFWSALPRTVSMRN